MSGWSTGQLEGTYFVTDLVNHPRDIAANLGNCPRDFVKATSYQRFDVLDHLREGSGAPELSRVSKRELCH